MRKVAVYTRKYEPETSRHIKIPDGHGLFQAWGVNCDEGCTYSTAIIMREDGTVENVPVNLIRFMVELP